MTDLFGKCEVCDKPTRIVAFDIEQLPPIPDAEGRLWASYRVTGDRYYRCSDHPREQREIDSPELVKWRTNNPTVEAQ